MFVPLRPSQEALDATSKLEATIRDKLLRNCVQAIIILGQDRNPIKRQELNKLAFPTVNYRVAAAIVQEANKELNKTFGMRLYELEDKTRYLLINSKTDFADLMNHSEAMCNELAVLYFVLIDIFVAPDERLSEDEIEASLRPLNLTRDETKSYLDSFTKRLYLRMDKHQESRTFSWGPRAVAEVDPESFFNSFLYLVKDSSDKNWPDLKTRINNLKSIPNR
mgnify:CR=1 FL=1